MPTVVEFPLAEGGSVLVETMDGAVTRGLGGPAALERAEETFDAALGTIRNVARSVLGQLSALARPPEEVTVEFGLEFTAKAGAVLASAGSTAQLRVILTWRPGSGMPTSEG